MKGGIMLAGILLQNMIMNAYQTVPYYKSLFDRYQIDPGSIRNEEDLKIIPVLERDAIQENPDMFRSSYTKTYPGSADLIIKRTSGSSGKYLRVYWSGKDSTRSLFELVLLRRRYYGIEPSDKFCSFYTTLYQSNKLENASDIPKKNLFAGGRNLAFSKIGITEKHLDFYYRNIMEFKPVWLFIQPSIAYLISCYISDNGFDIPESIKYVELTGEYLFVNCRKEISNVFHASIANMYGCNEANGIALECPYGNMHCLSGNVLVEISRDGKPAAEGEEGDICITGLTNTAMPFIRYLTGDRGSLLNKSCPCGNRNPILELTSGRVSDYITLKDGENTNCYILLQPIEFVNENMGNPVSQFQFVQTAIDEFSVYLVLKKRYRNWADSIKESFMGQVGNLGLGYAKWNFEFVERIFPDRLTGKLQFFVNLTGVISRRSYL